MWKIAVTLFSKYGHYVVIVLLVLATGAYIYVRGRGDERKVQVPRIEACRAAIAASELLAKQEAAAMKAGYDQLLVTTRTHYEERIHANNFVADTLRDELRRARASRPALSPARDAPAPCRDYEADRTKLPAADQDFLADFARRADECAIQANACSDYAVGLYKLCTGR